MCIGCYTPGFGGYTCWSAKPIKPNRRQFRPHNQRSNRPQRGRLALRKWFAAMEAEKRMGVWTGGRGPQWNQR